jgi:hypothetical protein
VEELAALSHSGDHGAGRGAVITGTSDPRSAHRVLMIVER